MSRDKINVLIYYRHKLLDVIESNISSGFHDNGYRNVDNFGALSVVPGNGGRPFETSFWLTLTGTVTSTVGVKCKQYFHYPVTFFYISSSLHNLTE
jgi:hypothetical protein